jgi:hypothetical protein
LHFQELIESALSTSSKSVEMLGRVMPVDKDKVNAILLEFQNILKEFKPNTTELQLINSKISQMTARNIEKQFSHTQTSRPKPPTKRTRMKPKKRWRKIKID